MLARVLPGPVALAALARLVQAWPESDPLLRLAALLREGSLGQAGIDRLAERLKLSNAQAERLALLLLTPSPALAASLSEQRQALYRLGQALYADLVRLAVASGRADADAAASCLRSAAAWEPPVFPLTGADLLACGLAPGPEFGRLLGAVRGWWEALDFRPDRSACLARLAELLAGPCRRLTGRRRPTKDEAPRNPWAVVGDGAAGSTSDSGSEGPRFDPWSPSQTNQ